jgi:8-oxo-dGTP diphosphatase
MIHQTKKHGDAVRDIWNGVGGKVEDNESPEECVIREVKEETGLTITKPLLKGILTFPDNYATGETWYVFVFVAKDFTGTLAESPEGALHWIPEKKLHTLGSQQADKYFIKWMNKKGVFSAKFNFSGDMLEDYSVTFHL